MTEEGWLSSSDPTGMLAHLRPQGEFRPLDVSNSRRLRLFACACCRRIWHLIYPTSWHELLELCEQYADRLIPYSEIDRRRPPASDASGDGAFAVEAAMSVDQYMFKQADSCAGYCDQAVATELVPPDEFQFQDQVAWQAARGHEEPEQANLLRDIFGNPFRPVSFDPAWRTEAAVGIAQAAYDSREFGNLPVLADALQDAGCEHPDILTHLRGPGPHVRGCWVVDLVLGKT